MPTTRQEVHERKAHLKRTLRQQCGNGTLVIGSLAPSIRQLAREFDVSASVATRVMQELIEEGLFHTAPRSGTFVGAAPDPERLGNSRFLVRCGINLAPRPGPCGVETAPPTGEKAPGFAPDLPS